MATKKPETPPKHRQRMAAGILQQDKPITLRPQYKYVNTLCDWPSEIKCSVFMTRS